MNEDLEKIIQLIEKETGVFYKGEPSNSGDTNLGIRLSKGCQLIFGVSPADIIDLDVKCYERNIRFELRDTNSSLKFLPFPFTDKQILVNVLEGLSEKYKADLNINRLIRDINFNDNRPIFIIITIIAYPIILPIA